MSTGRDDDALWWDGDDDPTLTSSASARRSDPATTLPPGYRAVGRGSEAGPRSTPAPDDGTDAEPALGNVAFVALGVLGGVYLLFSIGWLIGGLRLQAVAEFLVSSGGAGAPPTWAFGNAALLVLAVAAPPIWFATTLYLTRGGRPWVRWAVLAAGVVLLVPWPFVMVGAVGA